jgi:hypothetical protein
MQAELLYKGGNKPFDPGDQDLEALETPSGNTSLMP